MKTDRFPKSIRTILASRRKKRFEFMLKKIATKPGLKIIDIGCGVDGRSFDDFLDPYGYSVTGVDILPEERVKHIYRKFRYVFQDASDLHRYKDCEFDLAV